MLYKISGVLSKEQLKDVQASLENAEFIDGKLSAGKIAKKAKNNLELNKKLKYHDLLNQAVMAAIRHNQVFQHAALPSRISTPIFAKYTKGMYYGKHIDDPIMGDDKAQYRSDVALTLFLTEPEDYSGGELLIETVFGEQSIKLKAGDMVVYPASSLHQVLPVTDGTRLVMATWMQSMVKDPARRAILFDLWQVREELLSKEAKLEMAKKLDISYVNLLRMWAEPI